MFGAFVRNLKRAVRQTSVDHARQHVLETLTNGKIRGPRVSVSFSACPSDCVSTTNLLVILSADYLVSTVRAVLLSCCLADQSPYR